jgi:hypothetical protein
MSYKFSEQYIIKQQDTFFIQLEHKELYFNGVYSIAHQVDAIKLRTSKAFLNREVFVFKKNDANTFMK